MLQHAVQGKMIYILLLLPGTFGRFSHQEHTGQKVTQENRPCYKLPTSTDKERYPGSVTPSGQRFAPIHVNPYILNIIIIRKNNL